MASTLWKGYCNLKSFTVTKMKKIDVSVEDILPKGPYPPCLSMAGRALLAGYPLSVPSSKFLLAVQQYKLLDNNISAWIINVKLESWCLLPRCLKLQYLNVKQLGTSQWRPPGYQQLLYWPIYSRIFQFLALKSLKIAAWKQRKVGNISSMNHCFKTFLLILSMYIWDKDV